MLSKFEEKGKQKENSFSPYAPVSSITMIKPVFTIGASDASRLIRTEVFMQEQGFQNEFDEDDKTAITLVLFLDEVPIATGRLVKVDPATYQIGRIAVRKPYRHQQVGSYLISLLCEKARTMGARTAIVHAQLDKRDFYNRLGFYDYGGGLIDEDEGVPHIYLSKNLYAESFFHRKRK